MTTTIQLLRYSRPCTRPGAARAAYESMLQDYSGPAAGCQFIPLESAKHSLYERGLTLGQLLVGQDIAIVGAGVAGLNAAVKLQGAFEGLDEYQNNIKVFEASSEAGERVTSPMRLIMVPLAMHAPYCISA